MKRAAQKLEREADQPTADDPKGNGAGKLEQEGDDDAFDKSKGRIRRDRRVWHVNEK
jgi:hypothetical protein